MKTVCQLCNHYSRNPQIYQQCDNKFDNLSNYSQPIYCAGFFEYHMAVKCHCLTQDILMFSLRNYSFFLLFVKLLYLIWYTKLILQAIQVQCIMILKLTNLICLLISRHVDKSMHSMTIYIWSYLYISGCWYSIVVSANVHQIYNGNG